MPTPSRSTLRTIAQIRDNLYQRLQQKLSPTAFSLFSTLFLGNKRRDDIREQRHFFGFWGITHFLARSGLHVALFIMLWSMLFGFVPLPFFLKHSLLLLICGTYFLLSWPSVSFLRAFSVFLLYEFGVLCKQQTHFIHLLSLVCLTLLLF